MGQLARALEGIHRSIQVYVLEFKGKFDPDEYCDWIATLQAFFEWKNWIATPTRGFLRLFKAQNTY